jgi:hypothetical protein
MPSSCIRPPRAFDPWSTRTTAPRTAGCTSRRPGAPANLASANLVVGVVAAVFVFVIGGAGAARAETYTATGTTSLAREASTGALLQEWSIACASAAPASVATLVPGGHELRFAAAPDQVLVVGDTADDAVAVVSPLVQTSGLYTYDAVDGVHVFARLDVRCGGPEIVDAIVVVSAPIVTPPALAGPVLVTRLDTLAPVDVGALPVGVEVELAGVRLRASPRGDDVVELVVSGAGVEVVRTFGADDFIAGELVAAPRVTPTAVGALTLQASLLGIASAPIALTVVADEEPGTGAPVAADEPAGCAAGRGGPGDVGLLQLFLALGAGRRRRRAER